jgi:hypothetical protein
MNKLLALAAVGEAVLGLVLLVHPPVVVQLLFGAEIRGAGMVMSRITGISLIALGIACWPGRDTSGRALPRVGMFTYSSLATLYLAYQGLGGEWVGRLLWPAVVFHAALTVLLVRTWIKYQRIDDQE